MSKLTDLTSSDNDDDVTSKMLEYAHELLANLEKGDSAAALNVIHDLNKYRDMRLFAEVGRMTRTLHDAIVNFHNDTNFSARDKAELSRIRDASDRLSYVITMTDTAANKTMDMIEATVPLLDHLESGAQSLKPEWQKLMRKEMQPQEFRDLYRRIDDFLGQTAQEATQLKRMYNDIVVAQDYQDLTGQIIKRVITLVKEVEESLVKLVKMAAQVDAVAGIQHQVIPRELTERDKLEGPVIGIVKIKDAVSGQDEVDDLLSSLGF